MLSQFISQLSEKLGRRPEGIRVRVGDVKVTRLLGQFLKAGVLMDGIILPTSLGTPQGGVISPLLANIALGVIEERYERWTHHRQKIRAHRRCDPVTAAMRVRMSDRKAGRPVFFPIRYADDCVPRTHRRKEVRNCVRDGGRSSGAGRQGQASNHRKLRRSKAGVVSVAEKAGLDPVRYGSERRARANR